MTRRLAGIAHGWEGAAWVMLQRVRAGLVAWTTEDARALARHISTSALDPDALQPGQLLGFGGIASVAAHAAAIDPLFAPLADRTIARWCATTCDASRDDLFGGHPGALLALAEIESCPVELPAAFIDRCYDRTITALARMLDADRHLLGFAHGLAGILAAAEVGAHRLHRRRDDELIERAFDRLADARLIAPSLGTVWPPLTRGPAASVTGAWCHGAAGIALALSLCHHATGESAYRELLDEVAPTIERIACTGPTFCCGRSGQTQALIELYRITGDERWLESARALAATPVAMNLLSTDFPDGFSQGALGLEYVDARLEAPLMLSLPATAHGGGRNTAVTAE